MKNPQLIIDVLTDKIEQLEKQLHDQEIQHRDELQDEKDNTVLMWSFFYDYLVKSAVVKINQQEDFFRYLNSKASNENSLDKKTAEFLAFTFAQLLVDSGRDGEYHADTSKEFFNKFYRAKESK